MADPISQDARRELLERWRSLLAELSVEGTQGDQLFRKLADHYGETHRRYHTLAHIHYVRSKLEAMPYQPEHPLALGFATFLHDVIYDPLTEDNEARSADYAAELLQDLGAEPDLIEETRRLILLTQHNHSPEDHDGRMLVDADLASMGADPEVFDRFGRAIRQEFAHLTNDQYQNGRRDFFEALLARPRIYYTDYMYAEREDQARANLRRYLRALDDPNPEP